MSLEAEQQVYDARRPGTPATKAEIEEALERACRGGDRRKIDQLKGMLALLQVRPAKAQIAKRGYRVDPVDLRQMVRDEVKRAKCKLETAFRRVSKALKRQEIKLSWQRIRDIYYDQKN